MLGWSVLVTGVSGHEGGDDDVPRGCGDVGIERAHDDHGKSATEDLSDDEAKDGRRFDATKLSENTRPAVTAGFANDVELVNQ